MYADEVVNFYQIDLEDESSGDAVPVIIMAREGSGSSRESEYDWLVALDPDGVEVPMTYAEFFLNVAGRESEVLSRYHSIQADRMGRVQEMLPVVEREVIPKGGILPPIPLHHYENVRSGGKAFNCFFFASAKGLPELDCNNSPGGDPNVSPISMHVCAPNSTLGQNETNQGVQPGVSGSSGKCPNKTTGWMHLEITNDDFHNTNNAFSSQLYFGPSTLGSWASLNPQTVWPDSYLIFDWDVGTSQAKMAVSASYGGPKPWLTKAFFTAAKVVRN
jgi:hypothetical protein